MGRTFKFTATVTDLTTGKREQISDTATVDDPFASKRDAQVSIGKELARQNRPATNVTITD